MRCQAYKGPKMQQNESTQQVDEAKPKKQTPLYRLGSNRVKGCFACPFGWVKPTQGGALDGI